MSSLTRQSYVKYLWITAAHAISSISSSTQTGELSATASSLQPPPPTLVDEHISLLHHQLDMTSAVAGQLVCSQQGLISAVCRQLDSLQLEDRIQDHFARLHQYQAELEQYYQELQNVYFKVSPCVPLVQYNVQVHTCI